MSIRNFLSACLATVFSLTVQALDMPPRNPWLADSSCPMGHGDSAQQDSVCLLYTSDAADERSSVDLGGRRIIKKKK